MDTYQPFSPPRWLAGAHTQTVWSPLLRKQVPPLRHRERWHWEDGDFIDLDWCDSNTQSPLVVLLHGLTGCSNSTYIIGLQHQLTAMGWQSVVINFRGCSGVPNHLPRSYHSGDSAELKAVLSRLNKRFSGRTLAAVGYSLGGNVLLKYQGEEGKNSLLSCAVAVSVPFRLDLCAKRMNQGFSKFYRNRFLRQLQQQLSEKLHYFQYQGWKEKALAIQSLANLPKITTFQEFDHKITAPLHGFASGNDYYQQCSSRFYLNGISSPTLILHAKDDPFMLEEAIPKPSELSKDTCLELTEKGGHVGFVSSQQGRFSYWLDQRIPAFLRSTLG